MLKIASLSVVRCWPVLLAPVHRNGDGTRWLCWIESAKIYLMTSRQMVSVRDGGSRGATTRQSVREHIDGTSSPSLRHSLLLSNAASSTMAEALLAGKLISAPFYYEKGIRTQAVFVLLERPHSAVEGSRVVHKTIDRNLRASVHRASKK